MSSATVLYSVFADTVHTPILMFYIRSANLTFCANFLTHGMLFDNFCETRLFISFHACVNLFELLYPSDFYIRLSLYNDK